MSGPSIGSLKFAFWLVCVIVLLHCFMMPTALTVMAERTYKAKRGVLKTGVQPKEAYVPMSNSKWSKRSLCGIECHAKEWCLTFNFDGSSEKCELFDKEVVVSNSASGDSSAYFGKIGLPVGIATTTTKLTTTGSTTTVTTTPTTTFTTTTPTTITTTTTTAPTTIVPRACEELLVWNGTSIPSGRKHEDVVNISCNTGFSSVHKNVSCHDGVFKMHPAVKNESVVSIMCYKDCKGLVVSNGTNVTAAVHHEEEVDIKCDAGLSTYYPKAVCHNGIFKPSGALCGDYPQVDDPKAMRWHGQFLKSISNPSNSWDTALGLCKNIHKNGIMATALSAELLLGLAKIATGHKYYAIGMTQKAQRTSSSGMGVGWQWINTGTNAMIDIDTSETPKPVWYDDEPNDHPDAGEDNQENYGSVLWSGDGLRFNDVPVHRYNHHVICQFGYPAYEFELVNEGNKLVFPHESSLVGVSLQNCTESCLNSAFCRAFSYSALLSDCWHHSTPPSDTEAIVKIDENYDIYA